MALDPLLVTHPLEGSFVTLSRLTYEDMPSLWRNLDLQNSARLWDFLVLDVPNSADELWEQMKPRPGMETLAVRGDLSRLDYSKVDNGTIATGHRADVMGIVAYVNIDRQMRSLDIGSVILSPALQRTVASTEIHYLLLRHIFDEQGMAVNSSFHRAVWKCNALNQNSRKAAERLGFIYEGTLRRSRMARGKWVDSAWFSIVDDEWHGVKDALESWLDPRNFFPDGKQRNSLVQCRREVSSVATA